MKRTNIMLTDEQHRLLKKCANKEKKTLGELVRDAVDSKYDLDKIARRKSVALESYKEGFISIGKLSEILGIDPVSVRLYLKEKGIPLKTQEKEEILRDIVNA
jgi:predicted HTH domain antitoxin